MNKFKKDEISRILDQPGMPDPDRLHEVWDMLGETRQPALSDTREADPDSEATNFPDPKAIERVWNALEAHLADDDTVNASNGRAQSISDRRLAAVSRQAPGRQHRRDRKAVPPGLGRLTSNKIAWSVAAAVVLIAGIGALTLYQRPVTVNAGAGERVALVLPDDSNVELNSGTTLRYARKFGDTRLVELRGEAFFNVTENESPFVVQTFNANVRVLGTRFNVRAWNESIEPGTTVTLESGRVQLASLDGSQEIEMTPGQTQSMSGSGDALVEPDPAAVERALAWRTGDLVFKDERLGVILEDIERRFGVTVTVEQVAIARRQVTVAARNPETAESVLADLAHGLELKYRRTSKGWELYDPF